MCQLVTHDVVEEACLDSMNLCKVREGPDKIALGRLFRVERLAPRADLQAPRESTNGL